MKALIWCIDHTVFGAAGWNEGGAWGV